MDLFEAIKELCGCSFISDLAHGMPYNHIARICISHIPLDRYELKVLTDMYHYLTGKTVSFENVENAVISLYELSGRPDVSQTAGA